MDSTLYYLERAVRDRQHELRAEAERLAQARTARRAERALAMNARAAERVLLTTVARPGVSLVLTPRPPSQVAADCAERVAAWRRAASSLGRSLVNMGRRLEQVGRAA